MRGPWAWAFWSVGGAAALAAPALAQFNPLVPKFGDVAFATVGELPLLVDIYGPLNNSPGPYPLIIWIHGGAWRDGDKWPLTNHVTAARNAGFAVASINYRLTTEAGAWGDQPVIWPAQIHDAKGAVRFLRANAELFNLDPDRFVAWGTSAGGHLAALLGTAADDPFLEGTVGGNEGVSSAVQAVIDYCGPSDLLTWLEDVEYPPGITIKPDHYKSMGSALIGWGLPGQGIGDLKLHLDDPAPPYPDLVALCRSVSPMTALHGDQTLPAFFIAHGDMDSVVPHKQAGHLAEALSAAGAAFTYLLLAGAEHNALDPDTDDLATAFLIDRLIPCAADLDQTGTADLFDFLAFVNLFNDNDPAADCTADGMLNLFDSLCFTNLVNQGC